MLELPNFLPRVTPLDLLEGANIFLFLNVIVFMFFSEEVGDAGLSGEEVAALLPGLGPPPRKGAHPEVLGHVSVLSLKQDLGGGAGDGEEAGGAFGWPLTCPHC